MNIRMTTAAGLLLALAGCSTTTTTTMGVPLLAASNPAQDRWEGQSAGRFFAAYGPPLSDRDESGDRVYTWRGGYKTITVATKEGGKKGGKRYLSCKADIVTNSSYVIRSIRILSDQPGTSGSSYCAELLAPPEQDKAS